MVPPAGTPTTTGGGGSGGVGVGNHFNNLLGTVGGFAEPLVDPGISPPPHTKSYVPNLRIL